MTSQPDAVMQSFPSTCIVYVEIGLQKSDIMNRKNFQRKSLLTTFYMVSSGVRNENRDFDVFLDVTPEIFQKSSVVTEPRIENRLKGATPQPVYILNTHADYSSE